MKTLLSLIIVFLFSLQINAQQKTGNLHGAVQDKVTGQGLGLANVLLSQNGKTLAAKQADFDGKFSFEVIAVGQYRLKVSYIGYRDTAIDNISITEGTGINLVIQLSAVGDLQLQVTEIVQFKEPLVEQDNNTTAVTITKEQISKAPYRSVGAVAGGTYSTNGRQPSIRGAKASGTVVNIDGVRAFEAPPSKPEFNTEDYSPISENEYKNPVSDPLSTFSIDVDKASYSNIRRFLNNGQLPPAGSVRIEEMINYFDYEYPQPKDKHPFNVTLEQASCPWNAEHQIVMIGMQGKKIETKNLPPSNLVFLIDVSGSMGTYNKLPLVQESLKLMVSQLSHEDRVSLVVYAGAAGLVLPSTPGSKKEEIIAAIETLQSGGSTAGGAGIQLAYKIAKENFMKDGNNRVILATDGDFNIGVSSDAELVRMIEEKRNDGIFLTVLGYGMGNYKDNKMEQLADKGNGNYAYIDNIMEAKKTLITEFSGTMFAIAKDVKLQIEWNPAKVKGYRLIGYENRMLNKEDFNDDKKDAGELGAGHTVTALYEIIPAGKKEELPSLDPLKYQQAITIDKAISDELLTVKLRYKKPDQDTSILMSTAVKAAGQDFEKSTENLRWAATVASFGMLLSDSKFKGESNYKEVTKMARDAKGKDDNGYRAECIKMIEMAELYAGSVSKK